MLLSDVNEWLSRGALEPDAETDNDGAGKAVGASALAILINCTIAAVVGLVGLSVLLISSNAIREHTPVFQVESLLQSTPIRRISVEHNVGRSAEPYIYIWLSALVRVDHLQTALEQAKWFDDGFIEKEVYGAILSTLLRLGKEAEAAQLILNHPIVLDKVLDIARTLDSDEALDALRMLASILPDPDEDDFDYDLSSEILAVSVALADAGRIDEALEVVENAEGRTDKDHIRAAIASRMAAAGKVVEAFELTKQVKEKVQKLIAYENILDSGKASDAIAAEIAKDVVIVFGDERHCTSDDSPGYTHDRISKWIIRLMKNARVDDSARLGELCPDGYGFAVLARYFAEKGELPSTDAIERIAAGISNVNTPSEALARAGFIDEAIALYPLFKNSFGDDTVEALVVPMIKSGRYDELQKVINWETHEGRRADLYSIAFKALLSKGEIDRAYEVAGQVDWTEISPSDFSRIAEQMNSVQADEGIRRLTAVLEQGLQVSESDIDRLHLAIGQFVGTMILLPEQRAKARETLLDAVHDTDWNELSVYSEERFVSALAGMAKLGYVDEAKQVSDLNTFWPPYANPYPYIAEEYLRKAEFDSVDQVFVGFGGSWNSVDFSAIADLLEDEDILRQVEAILEKAIGADAYRGGFNFDFADTLISIGRVDRALNYIDMIEASEEKDALLGQIIVHLLGSKRYDESREFLKRIETDEGRKSSLELLKALADGGPEPLGEEEGSILEDLSPDLDEAKRFAATMTGSKFRARAYTYLAGAAQRSGAWRTEVVGLLAQAQINAVLIANPDDVMPGIARQYAELGRFKTAATICEECSPSVIAGTNASILNAIWYANTGHVRNDKIFGTYGVEKFDY